MIQQKTNSAYNNGLIRVYYEIICAYNSFNAYNDLNQLVNEEAVSPNEFLAQCYNALFDNCLSHLVKVVVHNSMSYTFQNVIKHDRQKIQSLLLQNKVTMDFYKELQDKLRKLRNKQLVHIDKEYLNDPNKIWSEIQITGDDLKTLITGIYKVIKQLYLNEIDRKPRYTEYDDKSVLEYLKKNYLLIPRKQCVTLT